MRFPRIFFCLLMVAGMMTGSAPGLHAMNRSFRAYPAVAAAMPQEDIASVSGTVADGSGKAIPGATISIKNAAGQDQSARTDSKGKYWISGLAAGTYNISVKAKGYKNFEVAGIPLAAGDAVPLDVLMDPGVSVEESTSQPATGAAQATGSSAGTAQAQGASPNWLYVDPVIPPPPPGATAPTIAIVTEQNQTPPTGSVTHTGGATSAVTGTVSDQSGAVLAGATVTLSNSSGVKKSATTSNIGVFKVSDLPPGTYDMEVTAPNFKSFQTSGIALTAGDTLSMDALLETGGEKTEVNVVAGGAAQVETENAEVSGTITQKEATTLMLNGRNFTQLITLTPGVSNQTGQDEAKVGVNGSVKYSVNGGRVEYNSFEVDGSDVLNAGLSGAESTLVVYPSLDAIQEVKVLTSNYGAQYGRTASGTVQVTTKTGGNQWHGNAYEFFRNEAMNARNYFDQTATAPLYRRNDFGFTIGGPLYIPHIYNVNKQKTFVFFSEEHRIEKSPSELQPNFNQAVPTRGREAGELQRRLSEPGRSGGPEEIETGPQWTGKLYFPDCIFSGLPRRSKRNEHNWVSSDVFQPRQQRKYCL